MNQHPRPSLQFKSITEACANLGNKLQNPGISVHIGGGLLALLLAAATLPAAGQMATASTGKFVGNVLKSTTTADPVFDTYWNQATPENSGKWESVEATRDVMNWTDLDFMYAYTRTNGIPFKQHTFVWGQQTPAWVTTTLTQAEQREEVEEWIAAFGARYPNTEFIDVVNEPLHAPAEYRAALGGAGATGWDWVIWSFEKARQHCPNAKLLLNDYSILSSDTNTTNYLTIINLLKERGLIDGIGEQAHFYESTSLTTIQNNLNRLAATGLPIYISELDINIASDVAQETRYQNLFPIFWTNPAVCGITFWGYKQGAIWRTDGYLLRSDGTKRPALTWLETYIAANPKALNVSVTAPANGQSLTVGTPVSASATAYGAMPFTVTFQKKLSTDAEFTTVSSDNRVPYTANLGVLPLGTHQIRAIMTDTRAVPATVTSTINTFTVAPAPPESSWDGGTTDIAATGDGASGGGDGTWDTTIQNWDPGNGLAHAAWNNATNDTAIFGGTPGTVSLGTGVTVGGLTFASAYTVNGNTITFGAAGTISNSAAVTISSTLAGTGPITKTGSSTLTLSGPNSYTGTTAINVGTIAISNDTALGTTAGNTSIVTTGSNTGGQLALSGGITSSENLSITGQSEAGAYQGAIVNNSGINTLSGNISLPSGANAIRITSGGGELIFGGTITRTSGANTLIFQAGTGAAITVNNAIANNNGGLNILSYAGGAASNGVTLKGGTANNSNTNIMENGLLKLGVTNALKTTASLQIGTTGSNTGFDVGTFDLAGFNQTIGGLAGAKNTGGTIAPDSSRVATNTVTGTSLLTVGNGNATATFNGVILDGGVGKVLALTKTGTGTQTLVGNSDYSGVTTISAGTLAITHGNALGSTAGNTTIAASGAVGGAQLTLANSINSPENITITGSTEQNSYMSAILNTGGNNTLSGNITLNPSAGGGMRLGTSAGSLTFSGNISQTGTSQGLALFVSNGTSLTVNNAIANNGGALSIYNSTQTTGTGTVTLKGVSGAGIGDIYVNQTGILKLGVTDALNTSANLIVGVATTTTGFDHGTFDLAGFNQTVNALNGNANTGGTIGANDKRKITNSAAGTGTNTLTVGNNNGTGVFNGLIQDGATAKIALTKTGAGNQTLNGTHTYTGGTTVNGGTLSLGASGSIANSASVSIGAGASLSTAAQATYTIPTGKPVNFAVDGTGSGSSGKITATGLNISNATVTYNITGPLNDAAYVLATYSSGNLTGTFLSVPADPVGYTLNYAYEGNKIALVQSVPNTAPAISDVANPPSFPSGGNSGALVFTITDEDLNSVTPSGSSDNPTLVPNGNIVFAGSGASRTVTITPVSGQSGTATITVTLTDNGSLTDDDTFTLTVTDNYLSWATANGVTGGANGDDDNDGVKNLVEYALINGGERGVFSGNTITYTKRGGVYGSDLTYMIESSETLAGSWTEEITHGPGLLVSNPTISYTFTPGTPVKKFARLKVTSQ